MVFPLYYNQVGIDWSECQLRVPDRRTENSRPIWALKWAIFKKIPSIASLHETQEFYIEIFTEKPAKAHVTVLLIKNAEDHWVNCIIESTSQSS